MNQEYLKIELGGHIFKLLPQKAVLWVDKRILLLADIHAGKASHFRKNGIPLSTDHLLHDLNIISALLETHEVDKIIILGDLYHTSQNVENTLIDKWLMDLDVVVELIIGNHDRHSLRFSKLTKKEPYLLHNIFLSHEPHAGEHPNIYGHLHPSYTMTGKGRQTIRLPAFYHNKKQLILPAFGSVNGGKMYKELVKKCEVTLVSMEGLWSI